MSAPFAWSQFLSLSEELGTRADEASLRSAISRAYYYVYHLALKRAVENGFIVVAGGVHIQLWRLFLENPEPDCKRLGTIAGRMKRQRERADYEDVFARLGEEVTPMLADAREFASILLRLPARHPNPKAMRQVAQ